MPETALLVMDVQNAVVAMLGDDGPELVATVARAADAARASGVPVIYVRVGFRPGAPEVSPHNPLFDRARAGGLGARGRGYDAERRQRKGRRGQE